MMEHAHISQREACELVRQRTGIDWVVERESGKGNLRILKPVVSSSEAKAAGA